MLTQRTIIVAGAGIAGLTASLTLARQGFRVIVLEKAERLEEAGAGLQLSPNASRILVELGLESKLAARATTPEAISIISAPRGEIARLPIGEAAAFRAGAPYWVLHRADLQAALLDQVSENPDIDLRLGCQFEDVVTHARGMTVMQRRGTARQNEQALALIGADGIWSTVRQHLFPQSQPRFSGLIAWRGTLDLTQLPREFTNNRVQLWMGPDAHLVTYPISGMRRINAVAVVSGNWNRPGWSEPGDPIEIKNAFASSRWPSTARMIIGAIEDWRKWALFTVPQGKWTDGTIALMGDAAHAMLPFAAQGAAMAIEDAAVLAKCLGEGMMDQSEGTIPRALQRYSKVRRPRVRQVMRAAQKQGRTYHLSGPAAFARDLAIRALGPRRLLARQEWIYDWRT